MKDAVDKIRAYQEKIDALTIRERGMVLLAVLAVMIFLWDNLLMSPLDTEQKHLQAELETRRTEVNALNIQLGQLVKAQNEDPNAAARLELETLRQELTEIEQDIQATARELVDPTRMAELLRTVINRTEGLTLRNLEGLGVTPLVAADGGSDKEVKETVDQGMSAAYKHGMRIRFSGDYMKTLEYLRRLEALEWDFFWDRIEFEVTDYPDSSADIRIYTLSLTKDWIKA